MRHASRIKARQAKAARLFSGAPDWRLDGSGWMSCAIRRGVRWHTALRWLRQRQKRVRLPSGEVFNTDHIAGSAIHAVQAVCEQLGAKYRVEYFDWPTPQANVRIRTEAHNFSCVTTADDTHDLENAEWCALAALKNHRTSLLAD